jgi:hypothetical protein
MILNVNDAPTILNQQFTLNENSPVGYTVGVKANDADGNNLFYMITSGNTNNTFEITIVASNATIPIDHELYDFTENGPISSNARIFDKSIRKLPNGLIVGIMGWMGKTADSYAPAAKPVTFNHDVEVLKSKIKDLIEIKVVIWFDSFTWWC